MSSIDGPYGIREPTLPLSVVRRPCVLPRECGPPSVRPSLCPSAITIHCLQAAAGGGRARVAETANGRHSYVAAAAVAHATSPCVLATREGGREGGREGACDPCGAACVHCLTGRTIASQVSETLRIIGIASPAIPTSSDHPSIPLSLLPIMSPTIRQWRRQARRVRCTIRRTESKMAFLGRCSRRGRAKEALRYSFTCGVLVKDCVKIERILMRSTFSQLNPNVHSIPMFDQPGIICQFSRPRPAQKTVITCSQKKCNMSSEFWLRPRSSLLPTFSKISPRVGHISWGDILTTSRINRADCAAVKTNRT